MGTNYYSVRRGLEDVDSESFWELVRREDEDILHIGKSSGGWCFSLHVVPEHGISDLDDWLPIFIDPERVIVDEYRNLIKFEQMMRTITARSWNRPDNFEWDNHSMKGPNGLRRHKLDRYCVKHGSGTWDCIIGNFS